MIDVRELRIGNNVLYQGNQVEVTGISIGYINVRTFSKESVTPTRLENDQLNAKDCTPIPITEELLEKCKFEKIRNRITFRVVPRIAYEFKYQPEGLMDYCYLVIVKDNNTFNHVVPADNDKECCFIPIKSFHQLQNLYFDLTGKEIEIRL
nr:hypothetical protein [uncultured Bacteroides sp.]